MYVLPRVQKTSKVTSPIRLNPMAENAEDAVFDRPIQVPIRLKETNPIISQLRRMGKRPTELTHNQTVKRNDVNLRTKIA